MIDNSSLIDDGCHDDAEPFSDYNCSSSSSSSNLTGNDDEPSTSVDRNCSKGPKSNEDPGFRELRLVLVSCYLVICVVGLVGNTLVIAVVARFTKMKTVTNIYILNLSVADGLFLVGLPMIATTAILEHWAFGPLLCKVYYVLTSSNMFTGTFTLTLMSADRFFAVWFPIKSLRFRATKFAAIEVVLSWVVSFTLMFPIIFYAEHVPKVSTPGQGPKSSSEVRYSCHVHWPAEHPVTAVRIYFVYTFLVGFVLPVVLISVFYLLLVLRLRSKRLNQRSASERRPRGRRNVTTLVTVIISVFIVCWLPYWAFQVYVVFVGGPLPAWSVYLFQFFTILTYSNSAINPVLYAFTNDSFKKAFVAACRCSRLTFDPELRSDTGSAGADCRPKKGVAVAMAEPSRKRLLRTNATVLYDFSGSVDRPEVGDTGNAEECGEKLALYEETNPKATGDRIVLYNETSCKKLGAI